MRSRNSHRIAGTGDAALGGVSIFLLRLPRHCHSRHRSLKILDDRATARRIIRYKLEKGWQRWTDSSMSSNSRSCWADSTISCRHAAHAAVWCDLCAAIWCSGLRSGQSTGPGSRARRTAGVCLVGNIVLNIVLLKTYVLPSCTCFANLMPVFVYIKYF